MKVVYRYKEFQLRAVYLPVWAQNVKVILPLVKYLSESSILCGRGSQSGCSVQ